MSLQISGPFIHIALLFILVPLTWVIARSWMNISCKGQSKFKISKWPDVLGSNPPGMHWFFAPSRMESMLAGHVPCCGSPHLRVPSIPGLSMCGRTSVYAEEALHHGSPRRCSCGPWEHSSCLPSCNRHSWCHHSGVWRGRQVRMTHDTNNFPKCRISIMNASLASIPVMMVFHSSSMMIPSSAPQMSWSVSPGMPIRKPAGSTSPKSSNWMLGTGSSR